MALALADRRLWADDLCHKFAADLLATFLSLVSALTPFLLVLFGLLVISSAARLALGRILEHRHQGKT